MKTCLLVRQFDVIPSKIPAEVSIFEMTKKLVGINILSYCLRQTFKVDGNMQSASSHCVTETRKQNIFLHTIMKKMTI